jgi:hypothetical protein
LLESDLADLIVQMDVELKRYEAQQDSAVV